MRNDCQAKVFTFYLALGNPRRALIVFQHQYKSFSRFSHIHPSSSLYHSSQSMGSNVRSKTNRFPGSLQGGWSWLTLNSCGGLRARTPAHRSAGIETLSTSPAFLLPFHTQGALQSHAHFLPPTFGDSQKTVKGCPSLFLKVQRME